MRLKLIFICQFILTTTIIGQNTFNGTIINAEKQIPISDAAVQVGISGVITNEKGMFRIDNPTFPFLMTISHINYYPIQIIIRSQLETNIVIGLTEKVEGISEVQIIGERIKRYYSKQYYYIVDFFLFDDMILSIGYENSILSKGQVRLTGFDQSPISQIPIAKPKKIFQDGFGNVHIFSGDSVYQVFVDNNKLYLLYPTSTMDFSQDLLKFQFELDNKFIFKEISDNGLSNTFFVIDTIKEERIELGHVYNEDLFSTEKAATRYRKWNPRLRGKVSKNPSVANDLFEIYVYDHFVIHQPVSGQIFKYKSSIVLFDHVNKTVTVYNRNLDRINKVKSKMPKHNQRKKIVIQDPETQKLFWLFYNGSKAILGEIDVMTGRIISTIETPSVPFIENINIRNGDVWFLYQPRLGERVRSLYRMR